jgi:ribosomal protein S18 acetylase RimI-like enzyme
MSANLGYVDELVVDSAYRNHGIGKKLIGEIQNIAKSLAVSVWN